MCRAAVPVCCVLCAVAVCCVPCGSAPVRSCAVCRVRFPGHGLRHPHAEPSFFDPPCIPLCLPCTTHVRQSCGSHVQLLGCALPPAFQLLGCALPPTLQLLGARCRPCHGGRSQVRVPSRSPSPQWWPTRFRLAPRTHDAPPWGVRVVSLTESRKITTRKNLPLAGEGAATRD